MRPAPSRSKIIHSTINSFGIRSSTFPVKKDFTCSVSAAGFSRQAEQSVPPPDLARIAALSREDLTDLESRYVAWSNGQFLPTVPSDDPTFFVNDFFRDWGHQFIYIRRTLSSSMKQCGVTNIVNCQLNESSTIALRALENESRMPEGFFAFETFTLEATNPG